MDLSVVNLSARPLHFHAERPVVVEAVGNREQIEVALVTVREVLRRGLIKPRHYPF